MGSADAADAARRRGAEEERREILRIIDDASQRCRQMPPRQEDAGVAGLRVISELRREIEQRGSPRAGT